MKRIYVNQYQPLTGPAVYRITKLVNDVSFKIGEALSHQYIADLCDRPADWTVTITED